MRTLEDQVQQILPVGLSGSVCRIVGLTVSVADFPAPLGAVCAIRRDRGDELLAEVVGFQGDETLLLSYGDLAGVRRGNLVLLSQSSPGIRVGEQLLGRVVDGRGRILDGGPQPLLPHRACLQRTPPPALQRPRITQPLGTGIRVIDTLLTCGRGQRLGIFAGSGVGKSVLLGQMARSTTADVNVVVLLGERGREVREFLDKDLGPDGLARSVVVVATSDEPALVRLRAAFVGTAIAEYFRDTGRDVLLMMDSLTRFALAQREIGLAAGEPPATRGYPPSVFAMLPRLLERSGRSGRGSITGLYTVLVEGDDTNEPISDAVRGILDGHVLLSRKLAQQSHFPAIDVLTSISRLMTDVATPEHQAAAATLRRMLATYREVEDLIAMGAYQPGSRADVDAAIQLHPEIQRFLRQEMHESSSFDEGVTELLRLHQLRQAHPNRDPSP
jgi:FliI/YscN family ATPase